MYGEPSVYLAGPIDGLTYGESTDWRDEAHERLYEYGIAAYSPMRGKDWLAREDVITGHYDRDPLTSQRGIMARDRHDCVGASLVIANLLGAKKVSIGTMFELAWAYDHRVPLVLVVEPSRINVHEHPFVREAADYTVASVYDAVQVAVSVLLPNPEHRRTRKGYTCTNT